MNHNSAERLFKIRAAIVIYFFIAASFFYISLSYAEQSDRDKASNILQTAVSLFDEGETEKAISKTREAISISPDYAEAYDQIGTMLLKKGQYDEALVAFQNALKLNQSLRTSRTGIGFALLGKGDLTGAETNLMNALALNPYPSMTHYALGLVYSRMNNDEKAVFHFKQGLKTFKESRK